MIFVISNNIFDNSIYSAIAIKGINTCLLSLCIVVCVVNGGVRHFNDGFKWRSHGIHRK